MEQKRPGRERSRALLWVDSLSGEASKILRFWGQSSTSLVAWPGSGVWQFPPPSVPHPGRREGRKRELSGTAGRSGKNPARLQRVSFRLVYRPEE